MTTENTDFNSEEQTEFQKDAATSSTSEGLSFERTNHDLVWVSDKINRVREELSRFIIGQHEIVELLIAGIFANGHVLLEGVPGVAKTLSSKVLAKTLNVNFSRIQFTPDLMPSDVLGTSIFNMKESEFFFKKGPIFSNIVLELLFISYPLLIINLFPELINCLPTVLFTNISDCLCIEPS